MQSIPNNSTAYATGSVSRVPRMIAATPMCRPMAYARTGVCSAAFRLLIHGSSNCVRGRALPRKRVRLSNRVRHQLWRYYPQMLKLTNDLAAPWFLELWVIASTPAKAGRLRKSTVERLLKQHRIRRMGAETVLCVLREPAIKVAEGVAEAASIHMRSLVDRLRIVNRQLHEAERKLD